jgi:hypothetical protein
MPPTKAQADCGKTLEIHFTLRTDLKLWSWYPSDWDQIENCNFGDDDNDGLALLGKLTKITQELNNLVERQ